jgi:MYXO-CTERM domain-containing protein
MRRTFQNPKGLLAACGVVATLALPSAGALPITLKFDDGATPGGTISYAGADGVDPLVGSSIVLTSITGINTPLNSGVTLSLANTVLNFTTGANLTEGPSSMTFSAGGSFVVTGDIPSLGVFGAALLTGTFTGVPTVTALGGGEGLFSGIGVDSKVPELVSYFGLTGYNFSFANTEIGYDDTGLDPVTHAFTADVVNADLNNRAVADSGATVGLMGLALVGLAAFARRREV